jgi:hypothetical protein
MTVEAFTSLPFQAGGAVAVAMAALQWVSYAPAAANTAIAMIGLSSMAGSTRSGAGHHRPLFGSFSEHTEVAEAEPAPVMPAARRKADAQQAQHRNHRQRRPAAAAAG